MKSEYISSILSLINQERTIIDCSFYYKIFSIILIIKYFYSFMKLKIIINNYLFIIIILINIIIILILKSQVI